MVAHPHRLVGAGVIGRAHAAILRGCRRSRPASRPSPIRSPAAAASRLARRAPLRRRTDAGRARPDAAIIATPNVLHAPGAHACIDRGVAVLVEKPLAEDFATAKEIASHAERADVPLLVGHFRRHNPVVQPQRGH